MNFKSEILSHYLDRDNLVSLDRDPTPWSSGNGLLYTGLFYTILGLRNELTIEDRVRWVSAVKACEVSPGVYNRNPLREDFEAHDDYCGIASASAFMGDEFARDILEHGLKTDWHYDNTGKEPGLRSDHSRFLGRVAFYYMAAGEVPGFLRRVGFNCGIRAAIDSHDHGGKILAWLQVQVCKKMKLLPDLCELFEQSIIDDYGSLADMLRVALGTNTHPFSRVTLEV